VKLAAVVAAVVAVAAVVVAAAASSIPEDSGLPADRTAELQQSELFRLLADGEIPAA